MHIHVRAMTIMKPLRCIPRPTEVECFDVSMGFWLSSGLMKSSSACDFHSSSTGPQHPFCFERERERERDILYNIYNMVHTDTHSMYVYKTVKRLCSCSQNGGYCWAAFFFFFFSPSTIGFRLRGRQLSESLCQIGCR